MTKESQSGNNLPVVDLTKYSVDQLVLAREILMDIRAHLKRNLDTELPRDGQDYKIFSLAKLKNPFSEIIK